MPLLLLMLPAMLTALAVVREKGNGPIINLYVTPVTRVEFLLGANCSSTSPAGPAQLPAHECAGSHGWLACPSRAVCRAVAGRLLSAITATGMGLLVPSRAARLPPCFCHDWHLDSSHAVLGLIDPVSSLRARAAG